MAHYRKKDKGMFLVFLAGKAVRCEFFANIEVGILLTRNNKSALIRCNNQRN